MRYVDLVGDGFLRATKREVWADRSSRLVVGRYHTGQCVHNTASVRIAAPCVRGGGQRWSEAGAELHSGWAPE